MMHSPILGVLSILKSSCNLLLCLLLLSFWFTKLKTALRKMTIRMSTYPKNFVLYTVTRKQYLSAIKATTNNTDAMISLLDCLILQQGRMKVVSLSVALDRKFYSMLNNFLLFLLVAWGDGCICVYSPFEIWVSSMSGCCDETLDWCDCFLSPCGMFLFILWFLSTSKRWD